MPPPNRPAGAQRGEKDNPWGKDRPASACLPTTSTDDFPTRCARLRRPLLLFCLTLAFAPIAGSGCHLRSTARWAPLRFIGIVCRFDGDPGSVLACPTTS